MIFDYICCLMFTDDLFELFVGFNDDSFQRGYFVVGGYYFVE